MIKPREAKVTSLIKSYRYATQNFGSAVAVRHAHMARELELDGMTPDIAFSVASSDVMQDFYRDSNPDRAKEFCAEFKTDDALALLHGTPPPRLQQSSLMMLKTVRSRENHPYVIRGSISRKSAPDSGEIAVGECDVN